MKDPKKKTNQHLEEPIVVYGLANDPTGFFSELSMVDIEKFAIGGSSITAIQESTNLSVQTITDALGISKSKYYDMLQADALDFKTKDALVDLAYLWEKGMEAFDENQGNLIEWLNAKNENLGDIKPVNLFGSRMGRRELEKAFLRIEYSVYG